MGSEEMRADVADFPLAEAAEAVRKGLSFVCSTCRKWWDGKARGLDQRCTGTRCGGPAVGLDFPEYDGIAPDLSAWCYRCGKEAASGLILPGSKRTLGVCAEHVDAVDQLIPSSRGHGDVPVFVAKPLIIPRQV